MFAHAFTLKSVNNHTRNNFRGNFRKRQIKFTKPYKLRHALNEKGIGDTGIRPVKMRS